MSLDDAVGRFAEAVGTTGPVTVTGTGSRGGPIPGVRTVVPPAGVEWVQAAEMTVRCGAGTTVAALDDALAEVGQCVAIPDTGTVGGALAVGHSGVRRLGWGPVRDTVLQVRYVAASGQVVTAGGPTVKNVSGFDLCRLLVGSRGTLGFLSELILRTRPRPANEAWFTSDRDPLELLRGLYRPTSILWDGHQTWVLLDGHHDDVDHQVRAFRLGSVDGPPPLPPHRWSIAPSTVCSLGDRLDGRFVAEVGVGTVHAEHPMPRRPIDPGVADLHRRLKHEFDPTGRLNPGLDVLA